MQSLRDFISRFFGNKGQFVFLSLLVAKVCAFVGSVYVIRLLPPDQFGLVSIVASVFAVFVPFSGFGSMQSLLRFGAITEDEREQQQLSTYLFSRGWLAQLLLTLVFVCSSIFFAPKYGQTFFIFIAFACRLFGYFFYLHIQSVLRIRGKNREFARLNNIVNIGSLVLMLALTYFYQLEGYVVAMALSPFLSLFWFSKNDVKFNFWRGFQVKTKEIWNYGFHSALTALLSDTLFSLDVLFAGLMLNEHAVADYKVAILLPANITFLALTFMQSDFPLLAKNGQNRSFLKDYVLNYYKIFLPVCLFIFLIGFFLSDQILQTVFGEVYGGNGKIFSLLLAAFCMNMLFRNLYGNLLAAIGKMKINTIVSVLALVVFAVLAFIFIPKSGIFGVAIAMSSTLVFTSFALMGGFYTYYKNLK